MASLRIRARFYGAVVSELPPARLVGMAAVTRVLYFLKAPIDPTAQLDDIQSPALRTQHKLLARGPLVQDVRQFAHARSVV